MALRDYVKKKQPVKTTSKKIELPKVPVKSKPSQDSEASKRKRKRIKKVNVEKAGKNVFRDKRKTTKTAQKTEASPEEIQKEIKETLARLSNKGKSKSSKLSIGANNLFNKYPTPQFDGWTDQGGLADSVQMGSDGTYVFGRLSFNL